MNGKMKVAVLKGIRKIEIEEKEIPQPKEHEILVKIKHVGICGSDLHYYEHGRIGDFIVNKPIILGHESSGEVVEVGEKVRNHKVGDLVSLEPGYSCGKCEYCKTGKYNLCPDVVFMATPPYDGAFAEYVAYPSDMAFKLPNGMSTLEGALIEPLAVGFHAAKQGNCCIGQTAVILGAGCIGLVTLMVLRAMGLTEIYMLDVIPKRLEMAKKLGASKVFKADDINVKNAIDDLTNNKGVDAVFETAGNKISTKQTVQLVKRGGMIILVGMSPEATVDFDLGQLISKEASIHTVFRYKNLYPTAIQAVASGLVSINSIVTDVFKFDDIADAIKKSIENKHNSIKAVIEFDT